jgi:hypothetical protein
MGERLALGRQAGLQADRLTGTVRPT